jgi:hypothetical protein
MAAAFFNVSANPTNARALSARTRPGDRFYSEVVAVMREVGDRSGRRQAGKPHA